VYTQTLHHPHRGQCSAGHVAQAGQAEEPYHRRDVLSRVQAVAVENQTTNRGCEVSGWDAFLLLCTALNLVWLCETFDRPATLKRMLERCLFCVGFVAGLVGLLT